MIAWLGYVLYFPIYAFGKNLLKPILKLFTSYKMKFEFAGAIRLWFLYFLDLNISCFLQIRIIGKGDTLNSMSSLIASLFLIGSIFILILVYRVTVRWNAMDLKKRKYFNSLRREFTTNAFPANYYMFYQLIRRMITAFILVFLQDYSYNQISLLLAVNIIPVLLAVAKSPYKTMNEKITNAVTEFSYFFIHILIFALIFDNKNYVLSDIERINIGWLIIAFCIVSLLVNIILMLREFTIGILKILRSSSRVKIRIYNDIKNWKKREQFFGVKLKSKQYENLTKDR